MQLDLYLKKTATSQTTFGLKLFPPVSQGQLSQWIRGKTRITLSYALQINELSNGLVTPKDCADMYGNNEIQPSESALAQITHVTATTD